MCGDIKFEAPLFGNLWLFRVSFDLQPRPTAMRPCTASLEMHVMGRSCVHYLMVSKIDDFVKDGEGFRSSSFARTTDI